MLNYCHDISVYLSGLMILFTASSFIGWVLETVYKSIREKKFVNSGFLYGPFVPIYGFGSIIIYIFYRILSPLPIFLEVLMLSLLVVALEYFGSYIMEKTVSVRLWDYSEMPFNLNGRVCLQWSIVWMLLVIFQIAIYQDFLIPLVYWLPEHARFVLAGFSFAYFMIDLIYSSKTFSFFSDVINDIIYKISIDTLERIDKGDFEEIKKKNRSLANVVDRIRDKGLILSKLEIEDFLKMLKPSEVNKFLRPFKQFPQIRRNLFKKRNIVIEKFELKKKWDEMIKKIIKISEEINTGRKKNGRRNESRKENE